MIAEEPVKTQPTQTKTDQNNIIEFDIFGSETAKAPPAPSVPFSFETTPVAQSQVPVQQTQPLVQQPFAPQHQISVQTPINPQVQQQPFNNFVQPQQPFIQGQQPFVQQPVYGQPQYPHQIAGNQPFVGYNQYNQPQPNFNYPQNPQPYPNVPPQGYPQQQSSYNPYINPMYPTTAPMAVNQAQKPAGLNMGITLNTKKQE